MKTSDFDYELPADRIAQEPLAERDASRLLVLHRATGAIEHTAFRQLGRFLRPGDVLAANDSRVIPARLHGRKCRPDGSLGGRAELLLLAPLADGAWQAMAGGKGLRPGVAIQLEDRAGRPGPVLATITAARDGPLREVRFEPPIEPHLEALGQTPLPPYIHHELADPERYQTVYARPAGSAAAPTAGLHFTPALLLALRDQGVVLETLTLHVGLDTFQPVRSDAVDGHLIHSEVARLRPDAARRINEAKLAGGRLVAVGTTAVRVLETAALRSAGLTGSLQTISARDAAGETTAMCGWRPVAAVDGATDLYIYPGYRFRAVDALLTNFHLPRSSLLFLVSAFAGSERIRAAYQAAIEAGYRFYSFGDAMLIL